MGLNPGVGTGFGVVWCCAAAGIPGSRAEHLGPMDTQRSRESGVGPKGIRRTKFSNALARRLCGTHLSRPRPPVQSPLLK